MAIQLDLPDPLFVGTSITATLTFANPDAPDTPIDPGSVTVEAKQGGVWTTFVYPETITKVTVGKYTLEIPVTAAGQGSATAIGTDACAVTEQARWFALAPLRAPVT